MPLRRFAEDSLFRPLAVTLVCAAPAFAKSAPPSATPAPPSATPAAATPAAALDPAWIGGWIGVARLDQVEGKPSAELPLAFAVRIEGGAVAIYATSTQHLWRAVEGQDVATAVMQAPSGTQWRGVVVLQRPVPDGAADEGL